MNDNNLHTKPLNVSGEEWYAIDIEDPLMMVC